MWKLGILQDVVTNVENIPFIEPKISKLTSYTLRKKMLYQRTSLKRYLLLTSSPLLQARIFLKKEQKTTIL